MITVNIKQSELGCGQLYSSITDRMCMVGHILNKLGVDKYHMDKITGPGSILVKHPELKINIPDNMLETTANGKLISSNEIMTVAHYSDNGRYDKAIMVAKEMGYEVILT